MLEATEFMAFMQFALVQMRNGSREVRKVQLGFSA